MPRGGNGGALKVALASALVLVAACTTSKAPTAPTGTGVTAAGPGLDQGAAAHLNHNLQDYSDKGYIDGWFEGELVQLFYTKSFFCREPPDSAADATGCEIGADAQTPPRDGPIPTIYAIAAAGGIKPDPSTLACLPGSVCLNHPSMIDASRVGGPPQATGVPHSHILTERRAGWFHTVNIRVSDLGAWNQIAAAKRLEKVRELQADPNFVGKISADTPTNIYFFIASWR
jgi:hypothetical protein